VRLFTAIEPGELIQARSRFLVDELRRRAAAVRGASLTWVDSSRMHVTVRFIGDVSADAAAGIRKALAPPMPVAPFELACGGLVAFPNRTRPRVIACGVSRGAAQASRLEACVSDRLADLGVRRETRPYTPHVTLARVRDAAALGTEPLFDGLEDFQLGSIHVEAITLFESWLSPEGPTYTPLMRTPLAA
jgi:RNA 2',3'-cyclic 3'-phosphodiesterase